MKSKILHSNYLVFFLIRLSSFDRFEGGPVPIVRIRRLFSECPRKIALYQFCTKTFLAPLEAEIDQGVPKLQQKNLGHPGGPDAIKVKDCCYALL